MRTKTGIVTSNKMQNTVVVKVDTYKQHAKYHKRYLVSKKFYAHCEDSKAIAIGSTITIEETRPLSKLKRWKVVTSK